MLRLSFRILIREILIRKWHAIPPLRIPESLHTSLSDKKRSSRQRKAVLLTRLDSKHLVAKLNSREEGFLPRIVEMLLASQLNFIGRGKAICLASSQTVKREIEGAPGVSASHSATRNKTLTISRCWRPSSSPSAERVCDRSHSGRKNNGGPDSGSAPGRR